MSDKRKFVLTEIEITETFKQTILTEKGNYKVGDRLVIIEHNAYAKTKKEANRMKQAAIADAGPSPAITYDETLFYLRLPKESISIGTDHFGYDYLDNVFEYTSFFSKDDLNQKVTFIKDEVQQELKDRYF